MEKINVGDKVRSFDFAEFRGMGRDLEGERACYAEGTVEEVGVWMEGCPRYKIRVSKRVFGGEEHKRWVGEEIFPPENGTPTMFGEKTDGVEKI